MASNLERYNISINILTRRIHNLLENSMFDAITDYFFDGNIFILFVQ